MQKGDFFLRTIMYNNGINIVAGSRRFIMKRVEMKEKAKFSLALLLYLCTEL